MTWLNASNSERLTANKTPRMLYAMPFRGWLFILKIWGLQEIEGILRLFFAE